MKVNKKIVAALLASLMFGQTTNGLNLNSIKTENNNINIVKSSRKNLVKKALIGGPICIGIPAAVIVPIAIAKICNFQMSTPQVNNTPQIEDIDYLVEHINDRNLARKILNEVKKLQRRGGGIFEVDKSFCEMDPHVSLQLLTQINVVFDKLPGFEKLLIEDSKKLRSRFTGGYNFGFYAKELNDETAGYFVPAILKTSCECGGVITTNPEKFELRIALSKNDFENMNNAEKRSKESIDSGFSAKVSKGKELESTVVHELGHALQYALYSKTRQMLPKNDIEKDAVDKFAKLNKNEILEIAKKKYNEQNDFISGYGKQDEQEWFAELFTHAFLSDAPNKLGEAMWDFLKTHGVCC